jgi:Ca2+-binding RTX toxin-like protein
MSLQSTSSNNTTLYGGSSSDTLWAYGNSDVLIGGSGAETLYGYGSSDTLVAGTGSDTLSASGANDTLIGWSGDTLAVTGVGDVVYYGSNGKVTGSLVSGSSVTVFQASSTFDVSTNSEVPANGYGSISATAWFLRTGKSTRASSVCRP